MHKIQAWFIQAFPNLFQDLIRKYITHTRVPISEFEPKVKLDLTKLVSNVKTTQAL